MQSEVGDTSPTSHQGREACLSSISSTEPTSILWVPRVVTLLHSKPLHSRLPLTLASAYPSVTLAPSTFASRQQVLHIILLLNTQSSYLSAQWFSLVLYSSLPSLKGIAYLLPLPFPSYSPFSLSKVKTSIIGTFCFSTLNYIKHPLLPLPTTPLKSDQ